MMRISGLVLFMLIALFPGTALFSQERTLVHIEFWEQDGTDQQVVLDQLISEFQKKHKDIIIKRVHHETEDLRKNFVSAAIGGWGPDVVLGPNDNLGVFVPGDLIVPIDSVMGKSFIDEFDPVAVNASKYNNQVYMIPDRNGNELCLIYNKALVAKAPETWEQMVSIGTALKTAGKTKYTLAFCMTEPYFTIPFLKAFGGEVFDNPVSQEAQPTLNTPAVKEWCRFLRKIQLDGTIPLFSDYDVASNLFKEEKVPFLINGPWSFRDYIENHGMNIGIVPIPKVNGVWPAPYSAVKGYAVSRAVVKDERKKEAVKKFVRFMTGKDAQLKMSESHQQLPVIKSAIKDKRIADKEMMRQQQLQLEKAIAMPIIIQMRSVWDALKPVQNNIFAGKTDPDKAPAQMQRRAVDGMRAFGMKIMPTTDYPEVPIDSYAAPSFSDAQEGLPADIQRIEIGGYEATDLDESVTWLRDLETEAPENSERNEKNLFNLFIESFFNDVDFPGLQHACEVFNLYDEFEIQRRQEVYKELRDVRAKSSFYVSVPFNSGIRYDFSKSGFEISGINVEYAKGVIRSLKFGKNDAATHVITFKKSLFVPMDRSSAEQLRRDLSATVKLVFVIDSQQSAVDAGKIAVRVQYVKISGNADYYEYGARVNEGQ